MRTQDKTDTQNVTAKTVRIMIADDHALFREGLRRILSMEPDFEIIGEYGDGQQLLAACEEKQPDVVILDINMPVENGVVATEKLRDRYPDIKIIILSIHDDESYVFETLRKGASGYLLKDMDSSELVHAIRSVHEGYAYIHPKVTGKLINQLRRMTYLNPDGVVAGPNATVITGQSGVKYIHTEDSPLTKREAEVLRLMAEGKNNKAIGENLFISEKTVKITSAAFCKS